MNRGHLSVILIALSPLVIYLAVNGFAAPIPVPTTKNVDTPLKCVLKFREPRECLELLSSRLLAPPKPAPGTKVRIPTLASDNPLLFSYDYAYIVVQNTGPKDFVCFNLHWVDSFEVPFYRPIEAGFLEECGRGNLFPEASAEGCFEADVKTWDQQERDISRHKWYGLELWCMPPDLKAIASSPYLDEKYPKVTLEPGGKWKLPCRLFAGGITEPGTYTVQGIVKYLEAPGKQARTIETEKIKLEISKEQILEAKEFSGEERK